MTHDAAKPPQAPSTAKPQDMETDGDVAASGVTKAAQAARRRRIARGQQQEAEAQATGLPRRLQSLLAFPLLEALDEAGGKAQARDIYDAVADRLNMPAEARKQRRSCADGQMTYNVFAQQVRWARHMAKAQGLIVDGGRGLWQLADPAYAKLGRVRRGVTVLAWSCDLGIGLWAHAEDAASAIEPGSLQLVFTSPVYPIQSGRSYGRMTPAIWIDWMTRLTRLWTSLLTDDGVIALNVADCHIPGIPAVSPYLYRFMLNCIDDVGLYEQQPDFWQKSSPLGNIQWTATERRNPKSAMEYVKYLSKTPFPKRTVNNILVPRRVTGARAAKDSARAPEARPSGYGINSAAFYSAGDAIPTNVILSGGAPGNDQYARRCRAEGLPVHPARFPRVLPERAILQFTDPGDLVYDPMGGSGTTAEVAIALHRRVIVTEPMLAYVGGQRLRVDKFSGFQDHLPRHFNHI